MRVDYVRVCQSSSFSRSLDSDLIFPLFFQDQPTDRVNIGCDPKEFPTAEYIKNNIEAYKNPFVSSAVFEARMLISLGQKYHNPRRYGSEVPQESTHHALLNLAPFLLHISHFLFLDKHSFETRIPLLCNHIYSHTTLSSRADFSPASSN